MFIKLTFQLSKLTLQLVNDGMVNNRVTHFQKMNSVLDRSNSIHNEPPNFLFMAAPTGFEPVNVRVKV